MNEKTDQILALVREIRATLAAHTEALGEIKGRLGNLEAAYVLLSQRVDQVEERLVGIETRLIHA